MPQLFHLPADCVQVVLALAIVVLEMGSTSWRDNILQALLIGLVVQIVVSILYVLCASIGASFKEQMDSATG